MIGLKRFIRPGLVVSAIGHVGVLALGLLFAGANAFDPIPPDAMMVDIVSPNEAPRFEGAPSDAPSFGAEAPSPNGASPTAQPPPPPPAAPQPPQQRADPKRDARQAKAQPPATPQTAQPKASEMRPTAPPIQPQPHPEEAPDQPGAGEMFALPLSLPDGRLGGGFDAPAIDAAKIAPNETTAFRQHVLSCSPLPLGIDIDEKIRIVLRVSFKRDGNLGSTPQLIEASASPKGPILMQGAISALQKCQPYTMFTPDKYNEWKMIDLSFTPLNFSAR
jgi:hypothetical protein